MVVLDQSKIQNTLSLKDLLYCKQRGHVKIQSCRMQCMQWWCGVGCFGAVASFQVVPTLLLLFNFSFDFSDIIMIFPMSHLHDAKCLKNREKKKTKSKIHTTVHKVTVELKCGHLWLNIYALHCTKYLRLCQYFIHTNLFESFDSLCRLLQTQVQTTKFQVHRCYV